MKKFLSICLLFIILIIFTFSACTKRPDGMSRKVYSYGIEVVEATEQYLDGSITITETEEKVRELCSDLVLDLQADPKDELIDTLLASYIFKLNHKLFDARLNAEETGEVSETNISIIEDALKDIKDCLLLSN